MGLERGPLSLVSTIEELLERKNVAAPVYKAENTTVGSVTLTTWHPLSQTLALTSPTSGGRSVAIVRSRTQATAFLFFKPLDYHMSGAPPVGITPRRKWEDDIRIDVKNARSSWISLMWLSPG
jgi:hypothetical protein